MLAKLINVETGDTLIWDKFPDQRALAAENERALQETAGRLQWQPVTPYELGLLTAQLTVSFGGNNHDAHVQTRR